MQGDDMPEVPPETVTEQEYVDEHGHTVVRKVMCLHPPRHRPACQSSCPGLSLKDKIPERRVFQVTRKVIRRYVSSDGIEREEVTMQGRPQEPISVEDGDGFSKVIKRVVLRSDTEQSEVRPCGHGAVMGPDVDARRGRVMQSVMECGVDMGPGTWARQMVPSHSS